MLAAAVVVGCSPAPAPEAQSTPQELPRLISLAPHLTELAFDAGAGGQLVGVVAYSDYPAAAREITRVGDAFNLDYERIAKLAPDVVLAWEGGTPSAVIEQLEKMDLNVVSLRTLRLDDVADAVIRIGQIAGDSEAATRKASDYRAALQDIRSRYADRQRIRVFYQVSLAPLYTPGGPHFISELITLCGGHNIFSDLDAQAAAVSHEAVLAMDPQIIIVGEEWRSETVEHWRRFSSAKPEVAGIDADLVTRPGLRLAEGAAKMCGDIDSVRRSLAAGASSVTRRYGHASTALLRHVRNEQASVR